MTSEEILNFIKGGGYEITDEVKQATRELAEILTAEKDGSADITKALAWLDQKRKAYRVKVEEVAMKDLDKWKVDADTGYISHDTGKFFSIIGVKTQGALGREVLGWTQPMIKQEECGILGILCQKKSGLMRYLFYAKFEPGTPASLQLSPTLQATESNLGQAHGGKKPLFAEYFEGSLPAPPVRTSHTGGRPNIFYVYAIACKGGSYYIGHTEDLRKRWGQHVSGNGSDWTKRNKPLYIVHYEEFSTREMAVAREKELKTGFGRKWLKREIEFGRARQAGGRGKVLMNVVEVEDPGRNYHKTNRCMIVEVPEGEEIKAPDDFIWLNLAQVKKFLKLDTMVVSLARCVLGSR